MECRRCVGAERCTVPAFTGVQFIPRVSRRGQAGRRRGGPWPARGPAGSSPASSDCLRPPAHASLGDHELAHAQPTAPACASLQPLGAPGPIPPLHHELATAHGCGVGWMARVLHSKSPGDDGWLAVPDSILHAVLPPLHQSSGKSPVATTVAALPQEEMSPGRGGA